MNEVLTITDPGWNHWITSLLAIPGFILLGALIAFIISKTIRGRMRRSAAEDWAGGMGIVGGILTLISLFAVGIWGSSDYNGRMDDARTAGMEALGYTSIDFTREDKYESRQFTASRGGEYFRGALIEDGDLRWQIVELEGAK